MAPKLKELNAMATLVSETPASEDELRLEFLVSLNSPLAELANAALGVSVTIEPLSAYAKLLPELTAAIAAATAMICVFIFMYLPSHVLKNQT
ncbi:MAG: hypothetical protein HHJ15_15210 [Rhodoferax sp.]|uniref:hypothetical protein n=1 Tax=Rhodoferax sp. TaxID=50421 RepID=UPI0018500771|nr:hypothetical protein [Rhodoferax sp.]NMM21280.1 hypothetical protein [Rhodoferax sp.]